MHTVYIRYFCGIFGRESFKYIWSVCVRLVGLAICMDHLHTCIRCIYGIFDRESFKYTEHARRVNRNHI